MTNTFKAINTAYNGRFFRSRLEARWAVFYDSLGLQWDYEPEGFQLPSGNYLPDFYIPSIDSYIEIKGTSEKETSDITHELCRELAWATKKDVHLFTEGIIGDEFAAGIPQSWIYVGGRCEDMEGIQLGCKDVYRAHWHEDGYYRWCECPQCGNIGIQFDGRSDRLSCKGSSGCPSSRSGGDKGYSYDSPRILKAYNNARSARFEYGDTKIYAPLNYIPFSCSM